MWQYLFTTLVIASVGAKEVFFHSYYGTVLTNEELIHQAKVNNSFWCSVGIEQPCDPNEGRRLDGSCNNLQYPILGATHTPFFRLLPADFGKDGEQKLAQSGQRKPSSRYSRTTLISNAVRPDSTFTQLASYYFLVVAADIVSLQDTVEYVLWRPYCCLPKGKTDPACVPIPVPIDDPVHRYSHIRCLNMTQTSTYQSKGCIHKGSTPSRVTSATPLFDLSIIYGTKLKTSHEKGRLFQRGLLKYELDCNGRMFPPSTREKNNVCLLNQPPHETKCYDTPAIEMNSLFGMNIITVWFWRNHNRIAQSLSDLNPCWSDEELFETARDINIATALQILYYEFLPLLFGWDNLKDESIVSKYQGFRDLYDPKLAPQNALEYPYILRWGHLMQEGRLKMYDEAGNYLKQVPIVNVTLRSGYLAIDDNFLHLTHGSFRQAGGKIDYSIDPDMGGRVLGGLQVASDVATSDLEKGRINGFAPYVDYVKYCTGKTINCFDDLKDYIDADKLELLQDVYQHVRDIDLIAGTWVEKPIEGGFVPPTLYCIASKQLFRNIVSDRHWYERPNRPNAYSLEQLLEIRKASISRLLCDVGDKVTRIQRRGFERIGPKNRMVNCNDIPEIDLSAWQDDTCAEGKK